MLDFIARNAAKYDVAGAVLQRDEFRESMNMMIPDSRLALVTVPLVAREEVVGVVAPEPDPV